MVTCAPLRCECIGWLRVGKWWQCQVKEGKQLEPISCWTWAEVLQLQLYLLGGPAHLEQSESKWWQCQVKEGKQLEPETRGKLSIFGFTSTKMSPISCWTWAEVASQAPATVAQSLIRGTVHTKPVTRGDMKRHIFRPQESQHCLREAQG